MSSLLTVVHNGDMLVAMTPEELAGKGVPDEVVSAAQRAALVPSSLSRRQFFQQLAAGGDIAEADAIAALQSGAIPKKMADALAALPADGRFAATMLVIGAAQFERSHPMVVQLGAALGKDQAGLDEIWTAGSKL